MRERIFILTSLRPWHKMVSIIFLSSFLLPFIASVTSEPQYLLWVSPVIRSHSTEKACLHLLNLNESVSLSVVLEYDGFNTTIFDQSVKKDHFYTCVNFKVSQKSFAQLSFLTLLVKGNTFQIFERRSVALVSEETVTFVQTDKPIYKPGANVQVRIVTLDTKFKPIEELYPFITIQDPQNNKIFEWQNVSSLQNITQLSFQLTSGPILGDYSIFVQRKSGKTTAHQFAVNKYVLPKFEVKVSAPQTITVSDNELQVTACAKYTYGQPVQGKVQMQVCRKFFSSWDCDNNNEICEQLIAQLKNGCASQTVNTKVFQLYRSGLLMSFDITVTVTESGTGVQISERATTSLTPLLGRVDFENMDAFYRRGISYFGTLKFSSPANIPMVNKVLQLELNDRFLGNYTTDKNGEAQFSIDTSDLYDPELNLKATYVHPKTCHPLDWLAPEYAEARFSVPRFYSRTNSFLKIVRETKPLRCNQQKVITVHYALNDEAYKDGTNINFFYLMMVKGTIFLSGQKEIKNKAGNGSFSFPINISADLAPVADMFIYTIHPSGEIVADSVKFQVEKCFKNKVNIKFSRERGLPGSNISLHIQAAPNSFCALQAVDKSVLFLKPEQDLSPETVYRVLSIMEPYDYAYIGLNLDDGKVDPCIPQKDMFYNGLYYIPIGNYVDGDIDFIVKNIGLKIFTNLHYRKPTVCSMEGKISFFRPLYAEAGRYELMYSIASRSAPDGIIADKQSLYAEQTILETIRTKFPETWLWSLVWVNSSGSADLSLSIPDTLTQWKANSFCVNGESGFGISSTTMLEVFQPFFVEITFPFSVVRNEQSDLLVNVFSYLNTCVEISVQLETSQSFEASINTPKKRNEVIQAGEKKTYVWNLLPKKLGKANITVVAESKQSNACPMKANEQQNLNWKDTVVKSLFIKSEGMRKEVTQSFLICTKGTKVSKQVVLDLPKNVVEGSARARFTVVGDILGLAMQNIKNFLQIPCGFTISAGEENIARLASDVSLLDYLKSTQQLTEEVKSRIFFSFSNGYQKQLSFKNSDGSYRVFWLRNDEGSIWLSALTFKTLEEIKKYVFVDEQIQKQTLIWLSSKQKSDGCFKSDGKLFSNAWEGENEEISLTAYVVGAFLEAGLNLTFPALRNGLFCLEEALKNDITNGYTHAILAYVFALAGKEKQVESLFQLLDQSATKTDNLIYWGRTKKSQTKIPPAFIPWVPSVETEKTCYVLLAVISRKTPDLTYASKIVQWLAQQLNSHGTFSSNQGNAVCLLAITCYVKLTFSKGQNTVAISSEKSKQIFQVNSDNRLLVQRSELTKTHGQYTLEVEGQGCAFTQVTLKYNVPLPKDASGFSLAMEMVKTNSSDKLQSNFDLTVTLKYTGIHNNSNMVLVDVKMLSGFTPIIASIEELESNGYVTKVEVRNDHVLFYLENVFGKAKRFTFSVEQSNLVSNIQPASVLVYNYYDKDEYALVSYNIKSVAVSQ